MEDQSLGRHRELKDGGALLVPTDVAMVGELAVQAHTLFRHGIQAGLDIVDPLLHRRRTSGDCHLEVHPVVGVDEHRCVKPHESFSWWELFWEEGMGGFCMEEWSF